MYWSVRTATLGLALVLGITVMGTGPLARAQYEHDREARDIAAETGFQDGKRDGMHDRDTGHSFRPTHDDNYKHADRGYNSSMGDKNEYKRRYREAYERGYREGYNREEHR